MVVQDLNTSWLSRARHCDFAGECQTIVTLKNQGCEEPLGFLGSRQSDGLGMMMSRTTMCRTLEYGPPTSQGWISTVGRLGEKAILHTILMYAGTLEGDSRRDKLHNLIAREIDRWKHISIM